MLYAYEKNEIIFFYVKADGEERKKWLKEVDVCNSRGVFFLNHSQMTLFNFRSNFKRLTLTFIFSTGTLVIFSR